MFKSYYLYINKPERLLSLPSIVDFSSVCPVVFEMLERLKKMGRARSVPYKNRGSAIDHGYLDEICTEGRDEED